MEDDKKTYLQKLADRIIELDNKLEELKVQGAEAASVMKEDYVKLSQELMAKKAEAETKLNELKTVGAESWEELKQGAERAIGELSKAFDSALEKFKSAKK